MTTFEYISIFLKITLVFSAMSMVFNPSVVSIVATVVGLVLVGVLDLIDALRESIEWYEKKNNEN